MSEDFNIDTTPLIKPEDVAELHRKMAKRAMRNMLIVMGVKWALIYGINRWARSLDKNA
jgi:hypothetical protein